jgi:hypothetical protein
MQNHIEKLVFTYNFPVNNLNGELHEIISQLNDVLRQQPNAFNIPVCIILTHRETDEYRYFIPYLNSTIFEHSFTIYNQADLEKSKTRIEHYKKKLKYLTSNIPGHTIPKYFINIEMITYLNALQSLSYSLNKNKMSNILAKR